MDFLNLTLVKPSLIKLITIMLVFCLVNSQLTPNDLNYMKKSILSSQKDNGLFFESFENTFRSVYVLKVLNEKIPENNKICKEVHFQAMKEVTNALVELNELLKCKIEFDFEIKEGELENLKDISSIHEKVLIWRNAKNVDWMNLYSKIKSHINKSGLFSESSEKSSKRSLDATVNGLEILQIIYDRVTGEAQENVKNYIISVVEGLKAEFQQLAHNIGIFSSDNQNDLRTNSELAKVFSKINSSSIVNLNEINFKLLNYFLTFKYGFTNIENIFYMVQAFDALSNVPILQLQKRVFDYADDKYAIMKIVNAFNNELTNYDVEVKYTIQFENHDENIHSIRKGKDIIKVQKSTRWFEIPIEKLITASGRYLLNLNADFSNTSSKFTLNYSLPFTAKSKVKLNHLKIAVTNSEGNLDDKEVTMEYPKRSFKNIKATQKSVIRMKIKMNYGDYSFFKIEQMFLRLKHVEYGKSYSAHTSKYSEEDDYYYINFDMNDTNNMEPYDGIYELTLTVSDSSFENPMIWQFAKVEMKFKKPLDPSTMTPSYKNIQKEKMETSFAPEESQHKSNLLSVIFSTLIVILLSAYLIYLKQIKLNFKNFPKPSNTSAFVFSLGLVAIIVLVSYVLLLFYLKLRVVHALFAILGLILPGSLIIFKALSYISIEV